MQDNEIWKAAPGYENYYEVSNHGRVRSIAIRKHFQPFKVRKEPLYLKFNPIKGGYLIVRLYKDGIGKDNLVSRLVLTTFEGAGPEGSECDHIDSNTSNNFISNLRWATPRQNVHFAAQKRKHLTTSKYIGVFWDKRSSRWISKIKSKPLGINKQLGVFRSEDEAHFAYQKALSEILKT